MDKIRIGILGTGRLGGFHAQKAKNHPGAELTGVYDPYEPNRRRTAENTGVPAFDSIDELLAKIDAAVCACPTTLHGQLGERILKAGKHLLIEKPICSTSAEARRLVEIARNMGRVLTVGHVEQFNPAWEAAQEMIRSMKRSYPLYIDAERTSGYTFRCADVGAVLDLMIHDLELILSVIDAPAAEVSAWTGTEFGGCEDTASASIRFADGSFVRLFASRVETAPKRRMTIRTVSKRAEIDFASRTYRTLTPDESILQGDYAPERVDYPSIAPQVPAFMGEHYAQTEETFPAADALEGEMDDFIRAIRGEKTPKVPGKRACEAVELAERILAAAK